MQKNGGREYLHKSKGRDGFHEVQDNTHQHTTHNTRVYTSSKYFLIEDTLTAVLLYVHMV